jgi:hypothetical protein
MNGGWIFSFSPFKEKINKKIIKKNGWKREIDTNSEEENERQMGEEEDPSPYMCVTVKDDLIISHNFFHSLYFIFYYKIRLKKLTSQLSHLSDLAHQRWLGQNYHFTKMRKDRGATYDARVLHWRKSTGTRYISVSIPDTYMYLNLYSYIDIH